METKVFGLFFCLKNFIEVADTVSRCNISIETKEK